jgi:hypothetical protein
VPGEMEAVGGRLFQNACNASSFLRMCKMENSGEVMLQLVKERKAIPDKLRRS